MRLNNLINTFLGKSIGINLKRVKIRKVDKAEGKHLYVEFVGVPGVGKTTLYNNVFKQIKNKWLDISELQQIFAEHSNGKASESFSCYQDLAQHKVTTVASYDHSGLDKMKILKYFHSVLINDSLVYLFNKEYNIMSDEGVIHNFGEGIVALSKYKESEYKDFLKQRAIIYCETSASIIAKRIKEREKITGNLLPQHKVDSFDILVQHQEKALYNYRHIFDYSSKYNIPILPINTSEPMYDNIQKVIEFMTKLTDKK